MKHYWIFGMALVASILLLAVPGFTQTYTDVANITAARAESDGTYVNITGKVKVLGHGKLQFNPIYPDFAVQDTSGTDGQTGIFVYYGSKVEGISEGSTISGLKGQLINYNDMWEISLQNSLITAYTPTIYTGGDVLPDPAPLVLTGTEYTTNYANYEGELIQLAGTFDSPGGTFPSGNTNHDFTTSDAQAIVVRVFGASDLPGDPIPSGTQTIIGNAAIYQANIQIWPRFDTDLQVWTAPTPTPGPTTAVSVHWELYQ